MRGMARVHSSTFNKQREQEIRSMFPVAATERTEASQEGLRDLAMFLGEIGMRPKRGRPKDGPVH